MKDKIYNFFKSPWFIAFLLLAVYLATHGYRYGWDDQNLEIPLLKSFISHDLYPRDYYVQSLKLNYTSYFYSWLARLITVDQIPAAYFILFLVSRYFLFFWIYKLWLYLSGRRLIAFICTWSFMVFTRDESMLSLSFSATEFTFAMTFAGLYFFYKERFILAAMILGLATNFHALYGLFPMAYISAYLFFAFKKHGWKPFFTSGLAFLCCASPVILWNFFRLKAPVPPEMQQPGLWLPLFKEVTPISFTFGPYPWKELFGSLVKTIITVSYYLFVASLYVFNLSFNPGFRRNSKNHAVILLSLFVIAVNFVFSQVFPNKFVMILNLMRFGSFMFVVLAGFTILTAAQLMQKERPWVGFLLSLMLVVATLKDLLSAVFILGVVLALTAYFLLKGKKSAGKGVIAGLISVGILFLGIIFVGLLMFLKLNPFQSPRFSAIFALALVTFLLLRFKILKENLGGIKILYVVNILLVFTFGYLYRNYQYLTAPSAFDKLNSDWVDIQKFVKANTPVSALLLTPYDFPLGGFRIFSERSIVCCEQDKGIVGFDYKAFLEWSRRKKDIEGFRIFKPNSAIRAVTNAIQKYKIDYIVFPRSIAPQPNNTLQILYYNRSFALYQVIPL